MLIKKTFHYLFSKRRVSAALKADELITRLAADIVQNGRFRYQLFDNYRSGPEIISTNGYRGPTIPLKLTR